MKKSVLLLLTLLTALPGAYSQQRQWSLEECINHAIENNILIKQQALQTTFQENALLLSKMRLLPTVNGSASHNYSFGRALDETTYSFTENETIRSNQFFAGSNLTLFNGLQNYNNVIKSRFEIVAAEYDLARIKDNVSLNIALAYLQILLTKELLAVTEAQLDITTQQIDKTGRLVTAGSLARGNLLDVQAQAAREELQLINLQNQLELSVLNMTQFLELESPAGFDIVTPEIDVEPTAIANGDVDNIFGTAVGIRPEILGAETRLDIAAVDIKIAKAGLMPRLTLSSSFSTGYSDIRRKLLGIDPITGPIYGEYSFADQLNDNINYGLGFNLSIPIFNGWQVRTNVSNSRIQLENSRYQLENSRKQLFKDIQQASADAGAALKKYYASEKAVEATQESFRYSEQRFNVGLVTPVEYNAAKTQLLNAQSELLQSKYEYVFKIKVLDFYQGLPIKL
jgi:outer membrane protein